jgi:hypothetical protein
MDEERTEAFSKEDEAKVKERLRALGYLDWERSILENDEL